MSFPLSNAAVMTREQALSPDDSALIFRNDGTVGLMMPMTAQTGVVKENIVACAALYLLMDDPFLKDMIIKKMHEIAHPVGDDESPPPTTVPEGYN